MTDTSKYFTSWTPAELTTLGDLWEQGLDLKMIASKMGRSFQAIRSARRRFGLKKRERSVPWATGENEKLRHYWDQGMDDCAIAKKMLRKQWLVTSKRSGLGLEANRQHSTWWSYERTEALRRMWGEGLSASDIGAQLGISRCAVIGKKSRMGLALRAPRQSGKRRIKFGQQREIGLISRGVMDRNDPPMSERVSLLELDDKHCRWPLGDPLEAEFGFCGRTPSEGGVYCESHHKRAHMVVARKPRRNSIPLRSGSW